MRAGAEDVVPHASDGLDAGEDMGEPGEHPRDDEGQQLHLGEALKDALKLAVPPDQQLKQDLADVVADFADILGEVVPEVGPAGLLHHVVAGTAAEDDQEDGGDIVEALDVLQPCVLGEEAIEDLEDVPLPLPAE